MSTIRVSHRYRGGCCLDKRKTWARCDCGNSRLWDRPRCDRCQALKERGWRITRVGVRV